MKIIKRIWKSSDATGRTVKRVSYGYALMVDGRRERRVSAEWETEAAAMEALTARLKEVEAGKITPPPNATLGALADEYLRYKEDRKKRSLREDRRIIRTRLLPAFGADLAARKLSAPLIAQYEKRRVGEVSAYTVSNELAVLRHMLRLARKWGYIAQVPDFDPIAKPEGRRRFLDEGEIASLLDACAASRNPYLGTIVTIALNTGMRKAEVLGLEWERVDLATSRITLYRTKSGKPRGVPINRAVYDALVALEPDQGRRSGLLFKRQGGGAWGQIRTAFTSALAKAKITGFRFHDLRHTAASHLVMRGASLTAVQEVLGHQDLKMTQRYAHLSPAHLRGAVDLLDGLTPAPSSMAHEMAHGAIIDPECAVSPYAPVAQVDRAAVS